MTEDDTGAGDDADDAKHEYNIQCNLDTKE